MLNVTFFSHECHTILCHLKTRSISITWKLPKCVSKIQQNKHYLRICWKCSLGFQSSTTESDLHFNKIPRWFVFTLKFEMSCHRRCRRAPELHWREANGAFEWYFLSISIVPWIFNENEQLLLFCQDHIPEKLWSYWPHSTK